jgi:hypothetical protein
MQKFVESSYDIADHLGADDLSTLEPGVDAGMPPFDYWFWSGMTAAGAVLGWYACKALYPAATKKQKALSATAGGGVGTFVSLFMTVMERQNYLAMQMGIGPEYDPDADLADDTEDTDL